MSFWSLYCATGCGKEAEPRSHWCAKCVDTAVVYDPAFLGRTLVNWLDYDDERTQLDIAKSMHLDPALVARWTKNILPVPGYRVEALAKALDMPLRDLLNEADEPEDEVEEPVFEIMKPRRRGLETMQSATLTTVLPPMYWRPDPAPGRPRR